MTFDTALNLLKQGAIITRGDKALPMYYFLSQDGIHRIHWQIGKRFESTTTTFSQEDVLSDQWETVPDGTTRDTSNDKSFYYQDNTHIKE